DRVKVMTHEQRLGEIGGQAFRRRRVNELEEGVRSEHQKAETEQDTRNDDDDFHEDLFLSFLFGLPAGTNGDNRKILPGRLRFIVQFKSNNRTCAGLVALNSNAVSSPTAAASPPLSFFPL